MWELIKAGDWVMAPILACSVVAPVNQQRLDGCDLQTTRLIIQARGRTEHLHVVTALDAAAALRHVAIATMAPAQWAH